jgi:opacity protein-like surface antigen
MMPCAAQAEGNGMYVAPKFAVNAQSTEFAIAGLGTESSKDTTVGGAIAVGYDFSRNFDAPFRAELEYGFNGALEDGASDPYAYIKASVGIQTLLANAYWDITNYNGFTPYLSAGLGMAVVRTELDMAVAGVGGLNMWETRAVAAAQVGLGCSYAFNDNVAVDLGYRCLVTGDSGVEYNGFEMESNDNVAHQFMMGLRFTF